MCDQDGKVGETHSQILLYHRKGRGKGGLFLLQKGPGGIRRRVRQTYGKRSMTRMNAGNGRKLRGLNKLDKLSHRHARFHFVKKKKSKQG